MIAILVGMPRPRRIIQHELPYSVSTRCNNKEFLLDTHEAYQIFLRIFEYLSKAEDPRRPGQRRYSFQIHHFVLMSNHYHLVVSVSEGTTISKLLQLINSLSARAINKALGRTGHVWGERFFSKIVDTVDYLRKTVAYIYQNPWRAQSLRKKPTTYKRSTLHFYLRSKNLPGWLKPDPELSRFDNADRISILLSWILSVP